MRPGAALGGAWLRCGMLAAAVLLSGGCGKSDRASTLTVTMSLGEQEWRVLREEVFPPFEKANGVTIDAFQMESGQLATKLEALQAAGRPQIDLFAQDNMSLALLVDKGLVSDLSEYAGRIPPEVLPQLVESCRFDGKLMFMPFRPNVQIVYYNREAFDRYGLEPPATWEELLAVAKRFKEAEGEGRVLLKAFGGNPTATQVYEFVLQAGGDPYAFDDEGCVRAFTFLRELWPYVSEESRRAKWDTTNEIIARRQAYLAQNWPFGVVVLVGDYRLPFVGTYSGWRGPAGEYHVIGGEVLGIPKDARNKERALELIRYLQSKEVQEILISKLGWPSARTDAYGRVAEWQEPHYAAVSRALERGVFRKNVSWWPAYAKHVTEAFRDIVVGGSPVEETLGRYKEKLEREKALYR